MQNQQFDVVDYGFGIARAARICAALKQSCDTGVPVKVNVSGPLRATQSISFEMQDETEGGAPEVMTTFYPVYSVAIDNGADTMQNTVADGPQ